VSSSDLSPRSSLIMRSRASLVLSESALILWRMSSKEVVVLFWCSSNVSSSAALSLAMFWNSTASQAQVWVERYSAVLGLMGRWSSIWSSWYWSWGVVWSSESRSQSSEVSESVMVVGSRMGWISSSSIGISGCRAGDRGRGRDRDWVGVARDMAEPTSMESAIGSSMG